MRGFEFKEFLKNFFPRSKYQRYWMLIWMGAFSLSIFFEMSADLRRDDAKMASMASMKRFIQCITETVETEPINALLAVRTEGSNPQKSALKPCIFHSNNSETTIALFPMDESNPLFSGDFSLSELLAMPDLNLDEFLKKRVREINY